MTTTTPTVPKGLKRCPVCGEYRGVCWVPSVFDRRDLEQVTVSCLCDGYVCGACGKGRMHRPISNCYSEMSGTVLHVAYYCGWQRCSKCKGYDWVRASEVAA